MSNDEYWLKKYPSLKNGMTEWDRKALSQIAPVDFDENTIRYKMKYMGDWLENVEKGTPWKSKMGVEYQSKLYRWKEIRYIVNIVFQMCGSFLVSWGFCVLPWMVKPTLEQIRFSLLHICIGIVLSIVSGLCLGRVTTEWRVEKESLKWLSNALGIVKPLKPKSRKEIKKVLKPTRKFWLVCIYMPLCIVAAWIASILVEESLFTSIIHGPFLRLFGFSPIVIPEANYGDAICFLLTVLLLVCIIVTFVLVAKEERSFWGK